ncbi:MAG: dipeptidyl-peptidase-4 [Patiriisocius sp.]|jgi:dipeptidyl-peptidase-4
MKNITLLLICVATTFLSVAQDKLLTNEDIWYSRTFSMDNVSGLNSMNDGLHYTSLDGSETGSSIVKYAYKSGETIGSLVSDSDLGPGVSIDDYSFSADESKILIASEKESIYRRSSKSHYYIYDLASKKVEKLTGVDDQKERLAQFSPDGSKIAFVKDNNIFCKDLVSKVVLQVTYDGEVNKIINGATDWVYEEEFGFHNGLSWSANGDFIAYYKFEESEVPEFNMAYYRKELYPLQYKFKYPKAGEKNSLVNIYIYNTKNRHSQKVNLDMTAEDYIPRVKWTADDNTLCIMKMNRHQNHLQFLNAKAGFTKAMSIEANEIYSEKSETFIDINDNLIFLEDGMRFLWNSKKDGYNHIYMYDFNGKEIQLTKGAWDVIEFIGYDKNTKRIFFTSSEKGAIERQVYAVNLKGKKTILIDKPGTSDPVFSEGYKYFINYHSDANTPYHITLHDNKGKLVRTLVDNDALKETIKDYNFQPKTFFDFKNDGGTSLNGWIIKPPNFDENKKYPVLLAIYGGPGSNTVLNNYGGNNFYWHQMMAQKGYLIVSVDPRGTMNRGKAFEHSTYLQLGKLETEDMISTAKYLGDLSYVDENRIGIQGWSYGGYLSSLCMTKGADYFKAGVAVAPVTNWRYYDSIYTERFMRTPQENASGYDDNSPINHVEKLKGAYLLVHGSGDDNVHHQNSMEMITALVKENKEFDLMIYPDKNHGIYGGTTRLHLFNKITKFLEENL